MKWEKNVNPNIPQLNAISCSLGHHLVGSWINTMPNPIESQFLMLVDVLLMSCVELNLVKVHVFILWKVSHSMPKYFRFPWWNHSYPQIFKSKNHHWSTILNSKRKSPLKTLLNHETPPFLHGDGSKPWYLVNIKIAGKWMFIPLKMYL